MLVPCEGVSYVRRKRCWGDVRRGGVRGGFPGVSFVVRLRRAWTGFRGVTCGVGSPAWGTGTAARGASVRRLGREVPRYGSVCVASLAVRVVFVGDGYRGTRSARELPLARSAAVRVSRWVGLSWYAVRIATVIGSVSSPAKKSLRPLMGGVVRAPESGPRPALRPAPVRRVDAAYRPGRVCPE